MFQKAKIIYPIISSGSVSYNYISQLLSDYPTKKKHMEVSNPWGYPQIIHFNRSFHYKPTIWLFNIAMERSTQF